MPQSPGTGSARKVITPLVTVANLLRDGGHLGPKCVCRLKTTVAYVDLGVPHMSLRRQS
jgi:hypothetical protein